MAALDGGELEESRAAGREALDRFEALDDISKQGDALRVLGREAHQRGEHAAADRYYASALELERRAGDRRGEAEILDLRGMLQVDRDHYEKAVESFDEVLAICEELDDRLLSARVLAHKATALRWIGCTEEAERAAREAVERARTCGSPRTIASCEVVLGGVEADAGRPHEAEALLRRSLRAAVRMERPALEARAWLELAWLSDGPEASTEAKEAIRAARRADLVHVEILARSRVAELALAAGRVEEADRHSAATIRELERYGSIVGPEERVIRVRERVLRELGSPDAAEAMHERLRRAVSERADRIRDPGRRAAYLRRYEDRVA